MKASEVTKGTKLALPGSEVGVLVDSVLEADKDHMLWTIHRDGFEDTHDTEVHIDLEGVEVEPGVWFF